MEAIQPPSNDTSEDSILAIVDAELPLWVRIVQECREKLKSDNASADSESDPFAELSV